MKLFLTISLLALLNISSSSLQNKDEGKKINWMTIEEAEAAVQKEPRKVVIDVYTDWCGWCKRMDKTTFQNEVIVDYINENYYAVKLNAEQKDSIRFNGKTYKFVKQGRRGYHELAAILLQGKMSYPSIVYLNENLELLQPVPGYMNAKQFEKVIKFFGGDHFKNGNFEDFKKNFESEIQ